MRNLPVIVCSLVLACAGCKQLNKLTQFNMDYTASVVIPSSTVVNLPFDVMTPPVQSNAQSTFANNNTEKNLVQHINLKKMTLTITDPAGADFSFLKSISIYISASGLSETRMAWLDSIPAGSGNTIDLNTTGEDLQEYVKKDTFSLRLNTVTDKLLTSDYHVDSHSTFFVDAKILGL